MLANTIKPSNIFNKKIKNIFLLNSKTHRSLQKRLANTEKNNLLRLNIILISICFLAVCSSFFIYFIYNITSVTISLVSLSFIITVFRNQIISNPNPRSIKTGSHLITSICFLCISLAIPITGGIHSPLMSYYCLCPILADFLFNNKKIITWTIASCLGVCAQVPLHLLLPEPTQPPSEWTSLAIMGIEVFMIINYIYFNRRISSRYQSRLRHLNQKLSNAHFESQKKVKLRTKELEVAKNKAEESNRIKTQFLANMSHELRTPMHAILSFADLSHTKLRQLNKEHPNNNSLLEKSIKYQENIADSASRLVLLVNDLLDLSKLQSPRITYKIISNPIKKAIYKMPDEFKALLTKNKIYLKILNTNNHIYNNTLISYDITKITQVLRNLIANSLKFSPNNTVITIEAYEILSRPDKIAIKITDEGIGVPEDEKNSIFDPFIQSQKKAQDAKNSHSSQNSQNQFQQGTGLGLAICKKIIEAHGGDIWVENNKNKPGCSFIFTLNKS